MNSEVILECIQYLIAERRFSLVIEPSDGVTNVWFKHAGMGSINTFSSDGPLVDILTNAIKECFSSQSADCSNKIDVNVNVIRHQAQRCQELESELNKGRDLIESQKRGIEVYKERINIAKEWLRKLSDEGCDD